MSKDMRNRWWVNVGLAAMSLNDVQTCLLNYSDMALSENWPKKKPTLYHDFPIHLNGGLFSDAPKWGFIQAPTATQGDFYRSPTEAGVRQGGFCANGFPCWMQIPNISVVIVHNQSTEVWPSGRSGFEYLFIIFFGQPSQLTPNKTCGWWYSESFFH